MTNNPHLVPVTSKAKNDDEGQDHFIERKIFYSIECFFRRRDFSPWHIKVIQDVAVKDERESGMTISRWGREVFNNSELYFQRTFF
jgi:hypothetical protein